MKRLIAIIAFAVVAVVNVAAQKTVEATVHEIEVAADSALVALDEMLADTTVQIADKPLVGKAVKATKEAKKIAKEARDWSTWRPDIKKAMWMAIVIPGGGQIYNRKYWKLPIVYGGLVGCFYALRWNGQMYNSYQQAYMDIMDDDPETKSYENMMHLGSQVTDANKDRYKEVFRKRKDRFRRWRDLSFFCALGVYGLSIIDAYVDASLSQFDISDDLSLKVTPAFIDGRGKEMTASRDALGNGGLGFRCRLNF